MEKSSKWLLMSKSDDGMREHSYIRLHFWLNDPTVDPTLKSFIRLQSWKRQVIITGTNSSIVFKLIFINDQLLITVVSKTQFSSYG